MRRKIRKIIQTKKNEHVQGIIIIINAYYSDLLLYDYDYDYDYYYYYQDDKVSCPDDEVH